MAKYNVKTLMAENLILYLKQAVKNNISEYLSVLDIKDLSKIHMRSHSSIKSNSNSFGR